MTPARERFDIAWRAVRLYKAPGLKVDAVRAAAQAAGWCPSQAAGDHSDRYMREARESMELIREYIANGDPVSDNLRGQAYRALIRGRNALNRPSFTPDYTWVHDMRRKLP